MTNPLSSGAFLGEAAFITASAAAVVVPEAWPLTAQIYQAQCDPGVMYDAAQAWLETAVHLAEAGNTTAALDFGRPGSGWVGEDATTYHARLGSFTDELRLSYALAYLVGVVVIFTAVLLFIRIVIMLVFAIILAGFAVAIISAASSIVGDLGLAESLEVEANGLAATGLAVMTDMGDGIEAVITGWASLIGEALSADVSLQTTLGDTQALNDLGTATVDGLGTIATGLVAKLYQDTLGEGIGDGIAEPVVDGIGDDVRGRTVFEAAVDELRRKLGLPQL